jgi:hypothetical protein
MPRRPKDTPRKLAGRMKRRWRVVLLRANFAAPFFCLSPATSKKCTL